MISYNTLYDEMVANHLTISYKGHVSFEQTNSLLKMVELRLETTEPDVRVKKKVYSIATECIQNLSHHIDETCPLGKNGFIRVEILPDKYLIITGNHIYNSQIARLRERIDLVNSLSKDELRDLYKKMLDNNQFTEKGTAGLGFIDIARKADEKIEYNFVPVQNDISFFTLKVEIWKEKSK